MKRAYFRPERYLAAFWPQHVVPMESPEESNIWIAAPLVTQEASITRIESAVRLGEELRWSLASVQSVQLLVGGRTRLVEIPLSIRLGAEIGLTVGPIELALIIDSTLISPVKRREGHSHDGVPQFEKLASEQLIVELPAASLTYGSSGEFNLELSGPIAMPPFSVGDTGLVVEAGRIYPVFSRAAAEALPDTISRDARGVFLDQATVYLPSDISVALPSEIVFRDFLLGSAGISGAVVGEGWSPAFDPKTKTLTGPGAGTLLGIPFALTKLWINVDQNMIAGSRIEGALVLPYFDQLVGVAIEVLSNADFTVSLSSDVSAVSGAPAPEATDGLYTVCQPDLFRLSLSGIELTRKQGSLGITLAGSIKPLLAGLEWPEFEIKALTIDSKGRVSIDGGWIDLPTQKTLNFHGFAIEVSKIGFGSEDDGTRWIGFSGGLKLCAGVPMKGAVEGLRVCWKGSEYWLEFKGAEVAFEIPDSIAFAGRVEFVDDPEGPTRGFKGGGKLKIIPTGLEIDAQVVIGKNEKNPAYTFFYFFIESQLPAGIPLFSTGVALYGLGGLVAYNMEPSKTPAQAWYADWYKQPTPGVSDSVKWTDERGAFALGASVTLGTASDDGYAVNARALFVLVVPGPILLIEGKGALLQKRSALSGEPPFSALAVLDGRAGQFLLNLEAHYPSPPEGITAKLIRIDAGAEAFFDFHDWRRFHLFLGESDPRSKRIRAEILSLFEANAYLMLFSTRLEVGAWVGYDARWKLGPVRVVLAAWMDGNALVSWKPVQFKGDLSLFGEIAIKVFGVGLGISAGATVEVDVPTPYRVFAELFLKVNLPWPLPDLEPRVKLEWKEDVPPPTPIPLATVGVEHLKVSEKWELARCPRYDTAGDALWYEDATPTVEDASALEAASPVVPLDSKIVLSFARNVEDAALVGLNPSGVVAPERVGNYEFRYRLVQVQLDRRSEGDSSGAWQAVAVRAEGDPEKDKDRLWGSWLAVTGDAPAAGGSQVASMTKLLLYAKSPFEYARETIDDTYYDDFAVWEPDCGLTRVDPPRQVCVDDFKSVWEQQKGAEPVMSEIRAGDVIIIGQNLQVRRAQGDTAYVYYLQIGSHTQRATLILFPTKIRKSILHLVGRRRARVSLYDGAREVHPWNAIPDLPSGEAKFAAPGKDLLDIDRKTLFDVMVIEGQVGLSMLCYVTKEEADRFLTEVDTKKHAGSAGDAYSWSEENELFQPGSRYRVTATTEALRRKLGHDDWVKIQTFSETSYFRTADPPGMTEPSPEGQMSPSAEGEHYPDRGPLKDLSPYVLREKLVPLEGANPVYRSYDVGAEFNEPYVETMYLLAGKPLVVCVYDNNGVEVVGSTPDLAGAPCGWNDSLQQPDPRRADQEWAASAKRAEMRQTEAVAIGGKEHSAAHSVVPQIDLNQLRKKRGIWVGGEEFMLRPGTQYRATVSAMVPQIIIPLDSGGGPLFRDGSLQYARVERGPSHFVSVLKDDWGQAEPGYKAVSDGRRVVATGYRASAQAQKPLLRADVAQALRDAIGDGQPKIEPKAVFTWGFVTSRFASFVDHIHSFIDSAWDLRTTLGLDAWPQDKLSELRSLIEADDVAESQLFEKATACFGVSGRPLPERLEIDVLEDSAGRYGLLIESPEPIEWLKDGEGRVSLSVEYSEASDVALGPAYGPLKLIECNLAGDEWVEVLAQTDLDLSGHKIERVSDKAPTELFFVFPAGTRACAGTQLRVHSGRRPPPAPADAVRKDIYAERIGKVLDNEGSVLRILDPHGKELHRRQFAPRNCVSLQNVLLASDPDGTRTFVFLKDSNGGSMRKLEDGLYSMIWQFRRNAGPRIPVLWRHGSCDSETATIDFSLPPRA